MAPWHRNDMEDGYGVDDGLHKPSAPSFHLFAIAVVQCWVLLFNKDLTCVICVRCVKVPVVH